MDDKQANAVLTCPRCGTRYHAPGAPAGSGAATYRCARCENVFSVEPVGEEKTNDESLVQSAFDFDALDAIDEVDDGLSDSEPESPATPPSPPDVPAFTQTAPEAGDAEVDLPPEPAFMVPNVDAQAANTATVRTSGGRSWMRIGARFEVAVLVGFGAIALYLLSAPDKALDLVDVLPYTRSGIDSAGHRLDQISLVEPRGFRDLSRENRSTFIIAGKVINNSPKAVGALQVEGRIYSRGKELGRKVVFAGARASRRLVKRLSAAEITMLEKIKPPETYRLRPGAAEQFLIIFQDVPPNLDEFGCRVVSVRPVSS